MRFSTITFLQIHYRCAAERTLKIGHLKFLIRHIYPAAVSIAYRLFIRLSDKYPVLPGPAVYPAAGYIVSAF